MGIAGLYPFLHKKAPDCARPVTLQQLQGTTLAVDAKNFLYKLGYGSNSQTKPYYHLVQMANLYCDLVSAGISVMFVFDGKPPKEKQTENERRYAAKQTFVEGVTKSKNDIKRQKLLAGFDPDKPIDPLLSYSLEGDPTPSREGADDATQKGAADDATQKGAADDATQKGAADDATQRGDRQANSARQRSIEMIQQMEDDLEKECASRVYVTSEQVKQSKQFLTHLGAWVLTAPGEAEALCSLLNRLGFADYVASEDGDVFPFGARRLIRGIGGETTREKKMKMYDIDQILQQLKISRETLVDVCVLCQNDYNKECRIEGLGVATAYEAMLKHKNIENYIFHLLSQEQRRQKTAFSVSIADKTVKQRGKRKTEDANSPPSSPKCNTRKSSSSARAGGAVKPKKPPGLHVPPEFDYCNIRRIFLDVVNQDTVPEEVSAGNPHKFNLNGLIQYIFSLQGFSEQHRDLRRQMNKWVAVLGKGQPGCKVTDEQLKQLFPSDGYTPPGTPRSSLSGSSISIGSFFPSRTASLTPGKLQESNERQEVTSFATTADRDDEDGLLRQQPLQTQPVVTDNAFQEEDDVPPDEEQQQADDDAAQQWTKAPTCSSDDFVFL